MTAPEPSRGHAHTVVRDRILGIDDARFLALVGMMATHLWASNTDDFWTTPLISEVIAGKAAALFAVLAGVGIAFVTDAPIANGRLAAARLTVFGRGFALVVIGMTLGLVPGSIAVILVFYGVAFWFVIPWLRRPVRSLFALAVVWAITWPIISSFLRFAVQDPTDPFDFIEANWLELADPGRFVAGLLITGVYPVLTWVVYPIVGLAVGRLVLRAREHDGMRRLALRLLVAGAAVASSAFALSWLLTAPLGGLARLQEDYAGYGSPEEIEFTYYLEMHYAPPGDLRWLASPAPHTGTFFDLAITGGIAVAVIGGCLALRTVLPERAARLLRPVAGAGAAPLTIYTLHVIAAGLVAEFVVADWLVEAAGPVPWLQSSPWIWGVHVAGALVIGAVLSWLHRRGPLETLVNWTGRGFARIAGRAPVEPAAPADRAAPAEPAEPAPRATTPGVRPAGRA